MILFLWKLVRTLRLYNVTYSITRRRYIYIYTIYSVVIVSIYLLFPNGKYPLFIERSYISYFNAFTFYNECTRNLLWITTAQCLMNNQEQIMIIIKCNIQYQYNKSNILSPLRFFFAPTRKTNCFLNQEWYSYIYIYQSKLLYILQRYHNLLTTFLVLNWDN